MSIAPDTARRPTRILIFLFAIVASRLVAMRTGWSDAVVLPLVSFLSLALFEFAALPAEQRMTTTGWALNAVFAAIAGGVLWVLGG